MVYIFLILSNEVITIDVVMCRLIFLSCAHSLSRRCVSILVFQATNSHIIKPYNFNTMRGDPLWDLICNVIVDNTPPTFRVPICSLGIEV